MDCVLQFEGDRYHAHRVLRATKNRFGSTNELGVFEMTGTGLVGVPDPSELFGRTAGSEIGSAVASALEERGRSCSRSRRWWRRPTWHAATGGHRSGPQSGGDDRRRPRWDVCIALGCADIFVNVAGGVRIDEPGADLAVALAIASAAKGCTDT